MAMEFINKTMVYCKVAPSLGELEGNPNDTWGTKPYKFNAGSTVFFGMYDVRDYLSYFLHVKQKWILWAGSDIVNLANGFMFNNGKLKALSQLTKGNEWIIKMLQNGEHYVENQWEHDELSKLGIKSKIVPSFMGKVDCYRVEYLYNETPQVYISTGTGRQREYGFGTIDRIAPRVPGVTFHLYGDSWDTHQENIIVHGRVKKEQMNKEIVLMQAGIRLNETDGFSEIIAKSILWGQHPISRMKYKHIDHFTNDDELVAVLSKLKNKHRPNIRGCVHYRTVLNAYPWRKR